MYMYTLDDVVNEEVVTNAAEHQINGDVEVQLTYAMSYISLK